MVVDQSGAIIPNAFAQVFRKEPPLELAAKVRADEEGKFSARLPAGSYAGFRDIAVFCHYRSWVLNQKRGQF